MRYETIEVRRVAGALGAEVTGVDLTRPLGNQRFAELRQAFLEHLVLVFRDQEMSPDDLKEFSRRFGDLQCHSFLPSLAGHPEIIVVDKKADAAFNIGNGWHSDMSFLGEPPLGSALHARITPPVGGDTLFANMYAAYETLSEGMRNLLDGLWAVHDYRENFRRAAREGITSVDEDRVVAAHEDFPPVEHPVVRTHPETGRKALYVNSYFTMCFRGMTREESEPLLRFLFAHATKPEFVCRLRWTDDSLALWDNRCTQHFAINDYLGHRRLMHRATIRGNRPF